LRFEGRAPAEGPARGRASRGATLQNASSHPDLSVTFRVVRDRIVRDRDPCPSVT